jgi:hypothetical protein
MIFTSMWIRQNRRGVIIAEYETEVPKKENVVGNCVANLLSRWGCEANPKAGVCPPT